MQGELLSSSIKELLKQQHQHQLRQQQERQQRVKNVHRQCLHGTKVVVCGAVVVVVGLKRLHDVFQTEKVLSSFALVMQSSTTQQQLLGREQFNQHFTSNFFYLQFGFVIFC